MSKSTTLNQSPSTKPEDSATPETIKTDAEKIQTISPTEKLKGKKFRLIGNETASLSIDENLELQINGENAGKVKELRGSLIIQKVIAGIPFTGKIPMAMLYQ